MLALFAKKLKRQYVILLLIAVYFINGIIYIPLQSVTGDEGDHMNYAVRLVKGDPEKIKPFDDASTMPVSVLNTIPRIVQQKFHSGLTKKDGGVSDIYSGRYITLLVSLLIGFYIFKWAADLYGRKAGTFAFFLFVFCPNINAHASLVTTDAYSALFTIMTSYYFWKYVSLRTWRSLLWFSISLGIAQLAKQSLTHLYIIFLLLGICISLREHGLLKNLRIKATKLLLVVFINILIINAGFLMADTGLPLKEYPFRSAFFRGVQSSLSPLASLPLPLPKPYLQGLDLTKNIDEIGGGHPQSSGKIYILGTSREGSGFWYYYLVTLLLKTPLTIIACCTLLCFKSTRKRFASLTTKEAIPLFIIFYLLVYFDFFYNSQVGIRHILFLFPLLYVLISPVANWLITRKALPVFALFIGYTFATFYYYFPNLISYTNEFVIPKRNAYKLLGDSNLDYRQGNIWMYDYLKKHKDVRLPGTVPASGRYIISVGSYLNLSDENAHNWLRNFEPAGHVRHCNLIFDISENDLKK
jgi:hypothetical protein